MNTILNIVLWSFVAILLVVCLNAELKLVKLDLHDTTKILMLMCIIVIVLKKQQTETFIPQLSLTKKAAGRECNYADLDLNEKPFDPTQMCNYKKPTGDLVEPVVNFPNSISEGKLVNEEGVDKPSVNGNLDGKRALFTLAHNKCSPDCCPSVYSSSCGCVCQNDEQSRFISSRGGNKTSPGL
jgi:hypothetical protein